MPTYFPYEFRTPDSQYVDLLYTLLRKGLNAGGTRQGVDALTLMQQTMNFKFSNGFPIITDRSIAGFWKRGIGELCAFINGATTVTELAEFGCTWWEPWADEKRAEIFGFEVGEIGPASYGGAFHDFPTLDGERFDQFEHLPKQIRRLPYDRVHIVTPWMPKENSRAQDGLQKTTIAPCHGWIHVRIIQDQLHLHMYQRAGDVPVGVPSNMVQYAALALMLEQVTGFEAVAYYHTISDAHIFTNQIEYVLEMIQRAPQRLPTVELTAAGKQITDIHDFRMEHFALSDYSPHPAITDIPVAV